MAYCPKCGRRMDFVQTYTIISNDFKWVITWSEYACPDCFTHCRIKLGEKLT